LEISDKFFAQNAFQAKWTEKKSPLAIIAIVNELLTYKVAKFAQSIAKRRKRATLFLQTFEEIVITKQGFFAKHGILGIIGCIDCTHINIIVSLSLRQFEYPSNVFMNRKNFYSINCQLVIIKHFFSIYDGCL